MFPTVKKKKKNQTELMHMNESTKISITNEYLDNDSIRVSAEPL